MDAVNHSSQVSTALVRSSESSALSTQGHQSLSQTHHDGIYTLFETICASFRQGKATAFDIKSLVNFSVCHRFGLERGNHMWVPLLTGLAHVIGGVLMLKQPLIMVDLKNIFLKIISDDSLILNVAKSGSPEALDFLIASGANIEARNEEEDTPLMLASVRESSECLRSLIRARADVNARNKDGLTALIRSVFPGPRGWGFSTGSTDCVQTLLGARADILARNYLSRLTAMDWALNGNHVALPILIAEIAKNPGIDAFYVTDRPNGFTPEDQMTLLNYGSYLGKEEYVRMCLGAGAKIDAIHPESYRTALIYATRMSHLNVVNTLIGAGADVTRKDRNQKTALAHAREILDSQRSGLLGSDKRRRSNAEAIVQLLETVDVPE